MTGLGYVGLGIGKGLYQGARQAGKYFKPTSVSSSVDDVKKTSIGEDLKSLFSNINPKNLKTESAVDWMKRWYSHPNFIRRYSPTGKYDKDAMQEHILEELVAYQPKNYLDLLNDKGLIKYLKQSLRSDGVSWGVPDQIYVNRTSFAPFNKKRLESVRAHELSHLIDYNGNWLSEADIEALLKPFNLESIQQNRGFLKRLLGDNAQYYLDPSEIHARMNQARFNLGLSPSDVFTEEMFNYISKKEDWYGMGKYIKDKKSFIDLMNKFWVVLPAALVTGALQQQEGKPKYIKGNFKQGGWLDKYQSDDTQGQYTDMGVNNYMYPSGEEDTYNARYSAPTVEITPNWTEAELERNRIRDEYIKKDKNVFRHWYDKLGYDRNNVTKRANQFAYNKLAKQYLKGDKESLTPEQRKFIEKSEYASRLQPSVGSRFVEGVTNPGFNMETVTNILAPFDRCSQRTNTVSLFCK
ncbi:hypothetical protein EBU95_04385 [bacterium]|nr:hypothetical protein [bacterium]